MLDNMFSDKFRVKGISKGHLAVLQQTNEYQDRKVKIVSVCYRLNLTMAYETIDMFATHQAQIAIDTRTFDGKSSLTLMV